MWGIDQTIVPFSGWFNQGVREVDLFETMVGFPQVVAPLFLGDLPGALVLASMGMEWLAPQGEAA